MVDHAKAPPAKASSPKGKVTIKAEALKSVIMYAVRYADDTIPEYDWKEVYGFLIGQVKGNDIHVEGAVPMTSGEATEVVFDATHYSRAWELDNEIAEKNERENTNSFVCGWWHTHPFKSNPQSIFLSSIDVANHLGFQGPNPLAIALVHDPTKLKSPGSPFGTKIFRLTRTDFTEADLNRYAFDLTADGTTKSDPNERVYYEVPFEVVDITPQLFFESLVDVFKKGVSGAPPEVAYKETDQDGLSLFSRTQPAATTETREAAPTQRLTSIQKLSATRDEPAGITIVPLLPNEMEDINKVHVLPVKNYQDADQSIAEADEAYIQGLEYKAGGYHKKAIECFRDASKPFLAEGFSAKSAFILNEIMECEYWLGNWDDVLVASQRLTKVAKEKHLFYFLGNAEEFKGRAFFRKNQLDKARNALVEARKHFETGNMLAKAGACTELIGRIYHSEHKSDATSTAAFFAKALQLYHNAITMTHAFEPAWVRREHLSKHAKVLEQIVRDLMQRIDNQENADRIEQMLEGVKSW